MKLEIKNVSKKYQGGIWGIKNFNLELECGVLGLLGKNGAGKSTLMRMLATITKPTEGKIMWNGIDITKNPNELRKVLGYLPQDFGIYPNLNAIEFLKYMAAVKGVSGKKANKRIDELIQLVNLTEACKRPIGGYSGGMKQRVGIAQALLNDPKLLIVDEPTVGLDPEERVRFRNILSDISNDRIVVFSTHIVSDAEATATRIAIISKGHLLIDAEPEKLTSPMEGKVWETIISSNDLNKFRNKYIISSTIRKSDGVHIRVINNNAPTVNSKLISPQLEDAYLYYITGKESI
ncbi:ABC transporter ATP-binding protein [Haloimpatiens massiliensis]|uniref:ABC transporter ATP-binding protein n=1 Tax=Haloimpatiens massiliensis TaxID=1658110 RepID=UPI000C867425|nr:ABC transporter ATP-binding protein [Haloimpatiens massiliensis]